MENVAPGAADPGFGIEVTPNARMASIEFIGGDLHVRLEDGGAERIAAGTDVTAIYGATLRFEALKRVPLQNGSIIEQFMGKERVSAEEHDIHVIAMRVRGVGEVWYLITQTFNFRKALGSEAGYLLDENVRRFLTKLTTAAPQAVLDAYVTAALKDLAPPPPAESLLSFLRTASK